MSSLFLLSGSGKQVVIHAAEDLTVYKFYRLDSARSSHTGGAGLGLAIAKEIITAHGGRIYADSGDGQTTFTVELPVYKE